MKPSITNPATDIPVALRIRRLPTDAIRALRQEFSLPPTTKLEHECYAQLCAELDIRDEIAEQLQG